MTPPGLTCVRCAEPLTPRLARHTPAGYRHVGGCKCGIDGCDRMRHAYGYCESHAHNLKRHGNPLGKPAMDVEDIEWMAETGESWEGACARLGRSEEAVQTFLRRKGRTDLAERLRSRGPLMKEAS